jgi:hypothetical protein
MRPVQVFSCPGCGQLVFFANTACLRCGTPFAFDIDRLSMVALDEDVHACANATVAACNWLAAGPGERCASCVLTRTRPADDDLAAAGQFQVAERAKRRLVFQLRTLGLTLLPRDERTGTGVAFDLLSSQQVPVTTGHAGGVITLDLAESDDVHRERVRTKLSEPYRTVLGHFRHEIGHYLFPEIVGAADLPRVRALFGDEQLDYQSALDRHYRDGAPADWAQRHVSEYATMHPAEDWAETLAHYLHLRGVLQTAAAYRLRVDGPQLAEPTATSLTSDPASVDTADAGALIDAWLPLSYALNAVSRSLGEEDLYPFVLAPAVMDKLRCVHDLLLRAGAASTLPGHGHR